MVNHRPFRTIPLEAGGVASIAGIADARVVHVSADRQIRYVSNVSFSLVNGVIHLLDGSCAPPAGRDQVWRLSPSQIVMPLYFNAHVHLTLPPASVGTSPLPTGGQYRNASEWIRDQDAAINWKVIKARGGDCARLNCMLNARDGVGYIIGHGRPGLCLGPGREHSLRMRLVPLLTDSDFVRRFKLVSLAGLPDQLVETMMQDSESGYLYDVVGVHSLYLASRSTVTSLARYAAERGLALYGHFGEGIDQQAIDELNFLSDTDLLPNTVVVHGLALSRRPELLSRFKDCRGLVWCYSANYELFRATLPVRALLDSGVRIALGTDSALAGRASFRAELAQVLGYARQAGVTNEEVFRMACVNGHDLLRASAPFALEEGSPANFQVVETGRDLTRATLEDVLGFALRATLREVVVDGKLTLTRYSNEDEAYRTADAILRSAVAGR